MEELTATFQYWFVLLVVFMFGLIGLGILAYGFYVWLRNRNREKHSLEYVLLQVALPNDNEIKIDAAEQMFASLYSIKKGGWKSRFKMQPHLSFEIVAKNEDIRFYVSVHRKLKDLVEKQIHGAYPDAEILEVPEYNIFSKNGRVAYTELQLKKSNYNPIKIYKDLATDPLSSLTTALAKMGKNEGAVLQMTIAPADNKWQKAGKGFISQTKQAEADPEKAKFRVDAKELEAIENKVSKPGFETTLRIVICS